MFMIIQLTQLEATLQFVHTNRVVFPLTHFIIHRNNILGGYFTLNVMDWTEDKSAPRGYIRNTSSDFPPHVIRCSMRQYILGVAPPTQNVSLFPYRRLSSAVSPIPVAATWIGLKASTPASISSSKRRHEAPQM